MPLDVYRKEMEMLEADEIELEWAARQYQVVTEYLVDVLARVEEIPIRINIALADLTAAITEEWS